MRRTRSVARAVARQPGQRGVDPVLLLREHGQRAFGAGEAMPENGRGAAQRDDDQPFHAPRPLFAAKLTGFGFTAKPRCHPPGV
jgi:hypothetical protein